MAGKDFERQVQDRLHNWGMDPSDGVWGKLEASLQKRRRRRRGYIVFLLTGLLAAGGLWYMIPVTSDAPIAEVQQGADRHLPAAGSETQTPGSEMRVPGSDKQDPGSEMRAPGLTMPEENTGQKEDTLSGVSHSAGRVSTDIPAKADTRSIEEASGARASQAPVTQDNGRSVKQRKPRAQRSVVPAPIVSETTAHKDLVEGNPTASEAFVNVVIPSARQASLAQVSPATPLHRSLPVVPVEASAPLESTSATTPFTQVTVPAAAPQLPETNNRERRLAFGIAAGLGRSGFSDGLLLAQEKAADAQGSGASGGLPVNPYEYRQDPATGFSFGAWMRMPIAKRITGNIGLAYAQWSTRTPVGQSLPDTGRVFNNGIADFTSSVAYTQGSQETYRNNYHLLQMPLDLSWQLNQGRKLPLRWEIGISPGLLLSSNALVRDSARALFSHPDNQRRFQLGLRTAFMFRLMPSSARPIEFGPVFQYQLNEVFNDAVRDNGHLYYLGVEARMPLFFLAPKQRGR